MIILASQSPRRSAILQQINIPFRVIPSTCEEVIPDVDTYLRIPEELATQKAVEVSINNPNTYVFGYDTLVFLDGSPLGKPIDDLDASRILNLLSNNCHEVITGVAVAKDGVVIRKDREITRVFFKNLSQAEIDSYIITQEPKDKAGAYGIQDRGAAFVKKIEGCYYNVVGLPVFKTLQLLETLQENMNG